MNATTISIPTPTTLETWFCGTCGSQHIHHAATVKWNPQQQDWDVEEVRDEMWCEACVSRDPLSGQKGEPLFGIPGDPDATDSMIGGGAR